MPRETVYDKLMERGGIFAETAARNVREGQRYSLRAAAGEEWRGRVELVVPRRGFCVTVESLNDSPALLTIEGSGPQHEAQFWFSTYGFPATRVREIENRWAAALKKIFT